MLRASSNSLYFWNVHIHSLIPDFCIGIAQKEIHQQDSTPLFWKFGKNIC